MMNEEVRRVMNKDPMTTSPDANLDEVIDKMIETRTRQVPVVVDGKLVAILTEHDIWVDSRDPNTSSATVDDVMNKNVIKITPLDKVGTAAELFMSKRFKTLPVVNLRNELKGIVTAFEVLRNTLTEVYPRPILFTEAFEEK